MSKQLMNRPPTNPVLTEDWSCDVCGDYSGASDDDMVIDHFDPNTTGPDTLKMAHVGCGESEGWRRA